MPVRYANPSWDSARWGGFEFREGDVVISAPSKSGTTWTQWLCALLIFDGDPPGPLSALSPWFEQHVRSRDDVHALYGAQTHRRFLKSHTPLDGIPIVDGVTYLGVGRDPRDAFVSLEHHYRNMDLPRMRALRVSVVGAHPDDGPVKPPPGPEELGPRMRGWRDEREARPENLAWILHHYRTFWDRRHEPNVELFHFADYKHDLVGELGRLAAALGYDLPADRVAGLAAEATFDRMRERAAALAPNTTEQLFKDPAAFFRRGGAGEWREAWTAGDVDRYRRRVASLVPSDLAVWAHSGRSSGRR